MTTAVDPSLPSSERVVRRRPATRRNDALDGLRGLALLGMLAWHAEVGWIRGGFARMTIFFVLSGYLAAASYLRMTSAEGGGRFVDFWQRRTVRLLPVTVLGVVFAIGVTVAIGTHAAREQMRGDVWSVLAYVSNWRFISDERAYGELFERPSAFMHYWSLSIEEQSFLLLPLVLAGAALLARGSHRRRFVAVAVLALGCMLVPLVVAHTPDQAYFGTHVRFGEFLVGVLLALALARHPDPSPAARRALAGLGLASLVALVLVMLTMPRELGWLYRGGMGLFSVPAVLVVAACVTGAVTVQRALSLRPLVAIGVWALSVYVLHWPLYLVVGHLMPTADHSVVVTVQIATAIALGGVVHHLFERPLMPGTRADGGWLGHLPRPPVRAVLGVSLVAVGAVAVLAALIPVPEDEYRFEDAAEAAAERRRTETTFPERTDPVVPVEGTAEDERITTLGIFGGSTALMLGLGLDVWVESRDDFTTVSGFADLGCGLVDDARRLRTDGVEEQIGEDCGDWREEWPAAVRTGGVEVAFVVTGVWDTLDLVLPGRSGTVSVGDPVADRLLAERLDLAVFLLSAAGADHVVVATTPVIPQRVWRERGIHADHPERVARYNELLAELADRHEQVTVFDYAAYVEGLDPETHERIFPDGVHATWESSAELWATGLGDVAAPALANPREQR